MHNQLGDLVELLKNTAKDQDENSDTRSDSSRLWILTFEVLVLLRSWNTVLVKINGVQKRLQDHFENLHDAAHKIFRLYKGIS